MGKNRTYASQQIILDTFVSNLHYVQCNAAKMQDNVTWLHNVEAYKTQGIGDAQEKELQALDAQFDGDDISTAEYAEWMKQRQQIESKYQNELNQQLAQVQKQEKWYEKMLTMLETVIQDLGVQIDTWKELLQSTDCSYCD